jgi:hypothetical protein
MMGDEGKNMGFENLDTKNMEIRRTVISVCSE